MSAESYLHLGNECLPPDPLLQHSAPDLAIHFSTTDLIFSVQQKQQQPMWTTGDKLWDILHNLRCLQ